MQRRYNKFINLLTPRTRMINVAKHRRGRLLKAFDNALRGRQRCWESLLANNDQLWDLLTLLYTTVAAKEISNDKPEGGYTEISINENIRDPTSPNRAWFIIFPSLYYFCTQCTLVRFLSSPFLSAVWPLQVP